MFTEDHRVWIVTHYLVFKKLRTVLMEFLKHFKISFPDSQMYKAKYMTRIFNGFIKNKSVLENARRNGRPSKITNGTIDLVKMKFEAEPTCSIRDAARSLNLSYTVVYKILHRKLNFTPYKYSRVQKLPEKSKIERVQFCSWIRSKHQDFLQNIIFSDEKVFVLKPGYNFEYYNACLYFSVGF